METQTVRTGAIEAAVDAFVALCETNEIADDAVTDDVLYDLNVPHWRWQFQGREAIEAEVARLNPAGERIESHRWAPTPNGALVEMAGHVADRGTYFRVLTWLELHGDRIARLTVYCTGEWDQDTVDRHRREAPMVEHNA